MSTARGLKGYGIDDYKRKVTRIVASLPSEDDALHLRQPRLTPVLAVDSIDVDLEGIPITLHETRFAGDRVQFVLGEGDRPPRCVVFSGDGCGRRGSYER